MQDPSLNLKVSGTALRGAGGRGARHGLAGPGRQLQRGARSRAWPRRLSSPLGCWQRPLADVSLLRGTGAALGHPQPFLFPTVE